MFSSYTQAVEALYQRINFESLSAGTPQGYSSDDFKLDRMRLLLEELGNPHEKIPAVHIAGTKGKGTTCILVAEILQQAGYRVGLFTSPHMYQIEERFQINGQMPSKSRFTEMVNQLMLVVNRLDKQQPQVCVTFFEIINALAWLYFLEEKVDIVVLEVGLGGRLDSTIFCQPAVTAITSISKDHTRILGNTLMEIAREKAGILKTGIPLVCGVTDKEAQPVILEIARKKSCPVQLLNRNFKFQIEKPWNQRTRNQQIRFSQIAEKKVSDNKEISFCLQQPGFAIVQNATLALAIINQLQQQQYKISDEAISTAMQQAPLPLRYEILADEPLVIVDSAHNEASVASVLETTRQSFRSQPVTLILSVSRDKDYVAVCQQLRGVERVIVTKYLGNPRALDVQKLAQTVQEQCDADVTISRSPAQALELARKQTKPGGIILATGSLFLAAEIRGLIK